MPSLQNFRSPFRRVKGKLFLWDVAYFEHLIAELNALDPPATDPAYLRAKELIRVFKENEEQVTRSNLLELEQTLLSLQPTEALIQRAPILRLRYKEVVGDAQFAVYTPVDTSKCVPGDETIRKSLIQDLKNVVSGIHWRYVLLPLVDSIEKAITTNVFFCVVAHTVLWAATLLISAWVLQLPFLSMLATVVYAGIIGGYVSSLRRVQTIQPEFDSLMTIQSLQNSRYFLWLSPLLGAIFAVVLLLVFIANLVGGTVFPGFSVAPTCDGCDSNMWLKMWPFLKTLHPKDGGEYAKLFLWSFIAGFAERFVPDILDRVIQRGQNAAAQAAGATAETKVAQTSGPPTGKNGENGKKGDTPSEPADDAKGAEDEAKTQEAKPEGDKDAALPAGKQEGEAAKPEAAKEAPADHADSTEQASEPAAKASGDGAEPAATNETTEKPAAPDPSASTDKNPQL